MEYKIPILIEEPSNSPDLNPIEMIWAILKKRIEKRFPQNLAELETAIRKEWENITQENIDNCINHVQKRIEEVYEKKGEFK